MDHIKTLLLSRYRSKDGTTFLGFIWVIQCLYLYLFALEALYPLPLIAWLAAGLTLIVVWATVERKRWGRLALMGIAGIYLLDIARSAFKLMTISLESVPAGMERFHLWLYGFGPVEIVGVLVCCNCLFTLIWLSLPSVRREFLFRKRASTRRTQVVIAFTLLVVMAISVKMTGPTRMMFERISLTARNAAQATPQPLGALTPGIVIAEANR